MTNVRRSVTISRPKRGGIGVPDGQMAAGSQWIVTAILGRLAGLLLGAPGTRLRGAFGLWAGSAPDGRVWIRVEDPRRTRIAGRRFLMVEGAGDGAGRFRVQRPQPVSMPRRYYVACPDCRTRMVRTGRRTGQQRSREGRMLYTREYQCPGCARVRLYSESSSLFVSGELVGPEDE